MENEKVTMGLDDVLFTMNAIAQQTDTGLFSVLVATMIDAHCDENNLDTVEFTKDLYETMQIGKFLKDEPGDVIVKMPKE